MKLGIFYFRKLFAYLQMCCVSVNRRETVVSSAAVKTLDKINKSTACLYIYVISVAMNVHYPGLSDYKITNRLFAVFT